MAESRDNRVNPPRQIVLPPKVQADPQLKKAFDDLNFVVFQLWKRGGGSTDNLMQALDDIETIQADIINIESDIEIIEGNVEVIKVDISDLEGDVIEIQEDITDIEDDLGVVKVDVEDLKGDVSDIEDDLTEFDDIQMTIVQDEIHSDVISTAISLTTSGTQTIICTAAVTITLNLTPDNQEIATVVIQNGNVTIDGNGRNVMGDTDITVIFANLIADATIDCKYILEADEWIAI